MFFSMATASNLFCLDSTSVSQLQLALQSITPGIRLLCHLSARLLWSKATVLMLLASFHGDRKYFGDLCSLQLPDQCREEPKLAGSGSWKARKGWKGFFILVSEWNSAIIGSFRNTILQTGSCVHYGHCERPILFLTHGAETLVYPKVGPSLLLASDP